MKTRFVLRLWCALKCCSLGLAGEILVGTTRISIPSPSGYQLITPEMVPYSGLADGNVAPQNQQLALFVPPEYAALAASGGIPNPARRFSAQISKDILQATVSRAQFVEVKRLFRTQLQDVLQKASTQTEETAAKLRAGTIDDQRKAAQLASTKVGSFPPHYEAERTLAFSSVIKYQIERITGVPEPAERAITVVLVHVAGKMLTLNVIAESSGLEWTREEARKWADMILDSNPEPQTKTRDWTAAVLRAIAAAVVGGIVGLFAYFLQKKRSLSRQ